MPNPLLGWRDALARAWHAWRSDPKRTMVGGRRRRAGRPVTIDVDFGRPYRVHARRAAWVVCLSGTAWLTRDGSTDDTILEAGCARRVLGRDAALVVGLPHCTLGIVAAGRGHGGSG